MRVSRRKAHPIVTGLVGAGLYLLFLSGLSTASGLENPAAGKVLAEVNGKKVSVSDYRRFVMKLGHAADGEEIKRVLLNKLIEEMLIIREAGNRGVVASDAEVDQSIRDFIARYGLTEEELEKSISDRGMSHGEYRSWLKDVIVGAKLAYAEVDARISVGESEIAGYYDRNRDLFVSSPEQSTVAAIVMDISENPSAEELTGIKMKTLRIVSALRKGASFENMVSLYSDDPSRERGGILGVFRPGELSPAFEKALAGLKAGEVSEPVWTVNRVSILRLAARNEALFLPLNEVRSAIYSTLSNERKDKEYKRWVRSLWEKASIVIH